MSRLWPAVSYPARVVAVIRGDSDDTSADLGDDQARWDDAYWGAYVRGPFAWQRFMTWWVARRWVRPRDVTREGLPKTSTRGGLRACLRRWRD